MALLRIDEPQGKGSGMVRPRPPLFRALGATEPPERVEVGGVPCRRVRVFKHDSWAATALYDGEAGPIVCKFNRQRRIGPLPMRWLGRLLARNERRALQRLADLPGVPPWSGEVREGGLQLRNAVAHPFIPGRPLGRRDQVDDAFFPSLRTLLDELHRRGMAYVDLHKRENVLVGDDGRPYLIDFQISYVPARPRARAFRGVLRILQRCDDYHFAKLLARTRPDLFPGGEAGIDALRPPWIRLHRRIARPFRAVRRRLLARIHVRDARGRATSEAFPEEAVRLESAAGTPTAR